MSGQQPNDRTSEHSQQVNSTGVYKVKTEVLVHLRFMFVDPEGNERFFRPAYEEGITVRYEDDSTETHKGETPDSDVIAFRTPKSKKSFTVEMTFPKGMYVINEPLGTEDKLNEYHPRAKAEEMADSKLQIDAETRQAKDKAEKDETARQQAPAREPAEAKAREEEQLKAARAEMTEKQRANVRRYGPEAEKVLEKRDREHAKRVVLSKSAEKRIRQKGDEAARTIVIDHVEVDRKVKEAEQSVATRIQRDGPPPPHRVFELPEKIALRTADWSCRSEHYDGTKCAVKLSDAKLTETSVTVHRKRRTVRKPMVGTPTIPVTLVLDPHWQHVRFEYFDRYYGHGPHKHKPISMLPLLLEGYDGEPGKLNADAATRPYKTRSNWHAAKDFEIRQAVQALPWIIQFTDDGSTRTAAARPAADTTLAFLTDAEHRYIKAEGRKERGFTKLEDTDEDAKPCANRLKYYDLPAVWKSRKHWCTLSDDDAGLFETMITKATTSKKPLIVSLDDIVLCNEDAGEFKPITLTDNDRPAVFFHEFSRPRSGDGGRKDPKISHEGVYREGPQRDAAILAAKLAKLKELEHPHREQARLKAEQDMLEHIAASSLGGVTDEPERQRILDSFRQRESVQKRLQATGQSAYDNWTADSGTRSTIDAQADGAATSEATKEDAANGFPYSKITLQGAQKNYIADYPHWTRVVVAKGDVYDVFDQRTEQDDSKPDDPSRPVGARAGVRWVKSAELKAPRTDYPDRPKITKKKYFAMQPFFWHEFDHYRSHGRDENGGGSKKKRYQEWATAYTHASHASSSLGRYDMCLLRCSGHHGGEEAAQVFQYFRFAFNFKSAGSDKSAYTKDDEKAAFREAIVTNVARRWNGPSRDDAYSPDKRAIVEPETKTDTDKKFFAEVVRFMQVTEQARAHMYVDVGKISRCWVNAWGNGFFGDEKYKVGIAGEFAAAHECGHVAALEDEYTERWTTPSYLQPSFEGHLPGDPFLPDGEQGNADESAGLSAGEGSVMKDNIRPRARHFWLQAEWLHTLLDGQFQVRFNNHTYMIEHHANCAHANLATLNKQRTYAFWPRAVTIYDDSFPAIDGKTPPRFDCFLYQLGTDQYSAHHLPAKYRSALSGLGAVPALTTFDGLLVVQIHMEIVWKPYPDHTEMQEVLSGITSRVATVHNFKYWGRLKVGTKADGSDLDLSRCLVHFSPRIVCKAFSNNPGYIESLEESDKSKYEAMVPDLIGRYGIHMKLRLNSSLAEHTWKRGYDMTTTPPTLSVTRRNAWMQTFAGQVVEAAAAGRDAFVMDGTWQAGVMQAIQLVHDILIDVAEEDVQNAANAADVITRCKATYDNIDAVATAMIDESNRATPPAPSQASMQTAGRAVATDTPGNETADIVVDCDDGADCGDVAVFVDKLAFPADTINSAMKEYAEWRDKQAKAAAAALVRCNTEIARRVNAKSVVDKVKTGTIPHDVEAEMNRAAAVAEATHTDVRDAIDQEVTKLKTNADLVVVRANAELTRTIPPPPPPTTPPTPPPPPPAPVAVVTVKAEALNGTVPQEVVTAINTAASAADATPAKVRDAAVTAVNKVKAEADQALGRASTEVARYTDPPVTAETTQNKAHDGDYPGEEVFNEIEAEAKKPTATPESVRDAVQRGISARTDADTISELYDYAWEFLYIIEDIKAAAQRKHDTLVIAGHDRPQTQEILDAAQEEADQRFDTQLSTYLRKWLNFTDASPLPAAEYTPIFRSVAEPVGSASGQQG